MPMTEKTTGNEGWLQVFPHNLKLGGGADLSKKREGYKKKEAGHYSGL